MKVLVPLLFLMTVLAVLWPCVVYVLVPVGVADGVHGFVRTGRAQFYEDERRVAAVVARRQVGLFQGVVAVATVPLVVTNLGWVSLYVVWGTGSTGATRPGG